MINDYSNWKANIRVRSSTNTRSWCVGDPKQLSTGRQSPENEAVNETPRSWWTTTLIKAHGPRKRYEMNCDFGNDIRYALVYFRSGCHRCLACVIIARARPTSHSIFGQSHPTYCISCPFKIITFHVVADLHGPQKKYLTLFLNKNV